MMKLLHSLIREIIFEKLNVHTVVVAVMGKHLASFSSFDCKVGTVFECTCSLAY